MIITRCSKSDLPAIQYLMSKYGNKMLVGANHINKRDYAYQARLESGELIGFVWCALMANNTVAYFDKVAVDPEHSKNGVISAIFHEMFPILYNKGVREVNGIIRHDQYHVHAAKAVIRMGLGGDPLPYSYVYANMDFMKKELGI